MRVFFFGKVLVGQSVENRQGTVGFCAHERLDGIQGVFGWRRCRVVSVAGTAKNNDGQE